MRIELSPLASKLWDEVQRGGRVNVEELKGRFKASKSGILAAIAELNEAGLITAEVEEDD